MKSNSLDAVLRHRLAGGNKLHAIIDINHVSIVMGSGKARTGMVKYSSRNLDEIFDEMDKNPAYVKAVNKHGETALHMAVSQYRPNIEIVRKLVEMYPASLRSKNCNGYIPLHLLCLNSQPDVDVDVLKCLIAAYPDGIMQYNAKKSVPNSATPILMAVSLQNYIKEKLIPIGRERQYWNDTQLHLAVAHRKHICVINFLLSFFPGMVWAVNFDGHVPYDTALEHKASNETKLAILRSMQQQCTAGYRLASSARVLRVYYFYTNTRPKIMLPQELSALQTLTWRARRGALLVAYRVCEGLHAAVFVHIAEFL